MVQGPFRTLAVQSRDFDTRLLSLKVKTKGSSSTEPFYDCAEVKRRTETEGQLDTHENIEIVNCEQGEVGFSYFLYSLLKSVGRSGLSQLGENSVGSHF